MREIKAPKRSTASRKSSAEQHSKTTAANSASSSQPNLVQPELLQNYQQIIVQQVAQISELTRRVQELEQQQQQQQQQQKPPVATNSAATSLPQDAERIAQLTAEIQQLHAHLQTKAQLEASLASLSHAYNELEASVHQKDSEIERLSSKLAAQPAPAPQAAASSGAEAERVRQLELQNHELQTLNGTLRQQAESHSRELASLRQETQRQAATIQQLQQTATAAAAAAHISSDSAELTELRTKVSSLEADKVAAERELEDVLVLLAKVEIEKTQLTDRVQALEAAARQ